MAREPSVQDKGRSGPVPRLKTVKKKIKRKKVFGR